jgi:hypothetical protein
MTLEASEQRIQRYLHQYIPLSAAMGVRLEEARLDARLVIQGSRMEYEKPIPGDFEAVCDFGDAATWERFRATLARHGRAADAGGAAGVFEDPGGLSRGGICRTQVATG